MSPQAAFHITLIPTATLISPWKSESTGIVKSAKHCYDLHNMSYVWCMLEKVNLVHVRINRAGALSM